MHFCTFPHSRRIHRHLYNTIIYPYKQRKQISTMNDETPMCMAFMFFSFLNERCKKKCNSYKHSREERKRYCLFLYYFKNHFFYCFNNNFLFILMQDIFNNFHLLLCAWGHFYILWLHRVVLQCNEKSPQKRILPGWMD